MKKYKPILLIFLSFLVSCRESKQEPELIDANHVLDPIIEGIIRLANAEAARLFPAQSRSDVRVATVNGVKVIAGNESRSVNDTLMYVVNYEDNKGFAIISATTALQPVLAVVPEGNYDPEIGTDNPGFNLFMDAAAHTASTYSGGKYDFELDPGYPVNINGKYEKTVEKEVTHYGPARRITLDQKWGQDGIYGAYCPNGLSGCVPLAIASIVTFTRYLFGLNETFYYTFSNRDIDSEMIDWEQIMKHQSSEAVYTDGTVLEHRCWATDKDAVHKTIGRLCRQIGYDGNVSYKAGSTGASKTIAPSLFKKYLPGFRISELQSFEPFKFMHAIDRGVIFLRADSQKGNGHGWFTDGYEYIKTEVKKYEADKPEEGMAFAWTLVSTTYKVQMLNLMRWGWHGEFDGWYDGSVLDPDGDGNSFIDLQCVTVCEDRD